MGRFSFGGRLVGLWLLGVLVVSISGFPDEDLVAKLPGQPPVGFRQFSGYIDVDAKAGRSLFYYFIEADNEPNKKPLTLWLNGGPGCSSVGGGAFTELGPFFPRGDGRGLLVNPMSWNRASNLLFVESPAGVGWSYSNTTSDYNIGDAATALDMHTFLLNWYEKFPEFKSRELFLTGESYADGKLPASSVSEEKLEVIRKYEQAKVDKLLSKYIAFCGKVKAEVLKVDKFDEPIRKIIIDLITGIRITKLVRNSKMVTVMIKEVSQQF